MREAARRKLIQFLIIALIISVVMPTLALFAATTRYNQSGSFSASGSPLLNPNFTSDAWNKWEIVAWGVFLSNFVVPMADSYESAFSTAAGYGSRGSGYKALNFSTAADPANSGILTNFLNFAIEQAMSSQLKPLFTTYYYVDAGGNILEKADGGGAKLIEDAKNPIKNASIQPEEKSVSNFRDILLVNVVDSPIFSNPIVSGDSGGWFHGVEYASADTDDIFATNAVILTDAGITYNETDYMALPPVGEAYNTGYYDKKRKINTILNNPSAPINEISFAKLPVLWVEGSDGKFVKVWDMLDPWDFQIAITMLAKEVNSDSAFDDGLGTTPVWETVAANINKAYKAGAPLYMDTFGNIVCLLDGNTPYVVIPAAYNKHLTSEPTVNLVNSLFLTGATSGISGAGLVRVGKQSVKSWWWRTSNDNETSNNDFSNYGTGTGALSWTGQSLPTNAVALYYDTDTLLANLHKDFQSGEMASWDTDISYDGVQLDPKLTANFGVLDLDLYGNRKFSRGNKSNYIVPKLELAGISKAGGLGNSAQNGYATEGDGIASLITLISYSSAIVNLLPASYNESVTEYVKTITWREAEASVLGNPVVVPTSFKAGSAVDKNKETWIYLARDFISYYGTTFYPSRRGSELQRASMITGYTDTLYKRFTHTLMYAKVPVYDALPDTSAPSPAVILHSTQPSVNMFMNNVGMSEDGSEGFIWNVNKYIKKEYLNDEYGGNDAGDYIFLTNRWIKAYPTNQVLTEVASYLGMRGDSEFAAAAAPYVYLSYLKIYGVDKVKTLTLNENPTKFNDKIYNAKTSPLFSFDPTSGTNIKSDEEMAREVSVNTWQLLSPTSGNEYKRQLLSSIVGNFVYDQYNRTVFGGSLEYRSGGIQQIVTRSQTGFLRFPSLEDNMFTGWFYEEYATVALWLLAAGLVFIIIFGIFRKRKATWFFISVVLLVSSVVVIPFTNDICSTAMDSLVSNIMRDKTTIWSLTEMLANERAEQDFLSTGLSSEEAELAASIMRDLSIVYTDRSLTLRQDVSKKVISLGNYSELQSFASTRWVLPSLLRQFTAEDNSANYLFVPLLDVADNAANAYWWYNPKDAKNTGGISASDLEAKYAVGTAKGLEEARYTEEIIKKFYPNYHYVDPTLASNKLKMSYRSITQSVSGAVPIHDYIYMYMNNTYSTVDEPKPLIPASRNILTLDASRATNELFWGDAELLDDISNVGGQGTFLSAVNNWSIPNTKVAAEGRAEDEYNYNDAHAELIQLAQKYRFDERDTMTAEFAYLWSTETLFPYFYALVKDTMSAMGTFDYVSGTIDNNITENAWDTQDRRLGSMINALSGVIHGNDKSYYGVARSNFMYQTGITKDHLPVSHVNIPTNVSSTDWLFTGYSRDMLDLESVFYNVIPYMYQMTVITGGLTGEHENDMGLFGERTFSEKTYQIYKGLPQSFLYRCNWVAKIVEAPAYNKTETIGYWDGNTKKYADVTMTYYPDAYTAATGGKREMVFSEAQMKMSGLTEPDLTTLELKLIKLNKDVVTKWTTLLNYINTPGLSAEVLCRQMALDALTAFNSVLTPSGLSNSAFSLYPTAVDLRSLSFDTLMRVILLNSTKNSNYFNTDAMEITILEYDVFTGVLLLLTAWVCSYGVTLIRAFFLAFLFLAGVFGVAKGVLSSNNSKKATLFGYLLNICLLFILSFIYYFIFNVLMSGANDAEYVNSGVSGVSVTAGWAIFIILVTSVLYCLCMLKMLKITFIAIKSGTGDLGFSTYKEKIQSRISKVTNGIREMRASHSFEDMSSSSSSSSSTSSSSSSSEDSAVTGTRRSSSVRHSRGSDVNSVSSSGSGAKALQGSASEKRNKGASTLDDSDSVDGIIARGGQQTPAHNPADDIKEYTSATSGGEKASSGSSSSAKGKNKKT